MRFYQNQLIFSASDFIQFMKCRYASQQAYQQVHALHQKGLTAASQSVAVDGTTELLQQRGLQHEIAYLQQLKQQYRHVIEIEHRDLATAAQLTREAMHSGADIIYQATFLKGQRAGHADFLRRVERQSTLGEWSYEVIDTKLANQVRVDFLLQLAFYSDLLAQEQGVLPEQLHVVLGQQQQTSIETHRVWGYYQLHQAEFFRQISQLSTQSLYPVPCSACQYCQLETACVQRWQTDRHLNRLAGITQTQIAKLAQSGIHNIPELSTWLPEQPIKGIATESLARLVHQAQLQHQASVTGEDYVEVLPAIDAARGFALLPPPSPQDVYFDMEGDPLTVGGLEYLFGLLLPPYTQQGFEVFWAVHKADEKAAFEQFIDRVIVHCRSYPDAHIYHYAPYEPTALKRLMTQYATREAEVDWLLREQKLVDLYAVVRHAIRTSEPRYSIKNLEKFYMQKRQGDVTDAGASIVYFAKWQDSQDAKFLADIERYNQDDCISTQLLHQWLLTLKPANVAFRPMSEPKMIDDQPLILGEVEQTLQSYASRLLPDVPDTTALTAAQRIDQLIFLLLDFYRRCEKPMWWRHFERLQSDIENLLDDNECLAQLQFIEMQAPLPKQRNQRLVYQYVEQDSKLKAGGDVYVLGVSDPKKPDQLLKLKIDSIDLENRHVVLSCKLKNDLPQYIPALLPVPTALSSSLKKQLFVFADRWLNKTAQQSAVAALLRRDLPTLHHAETPNPLLNPTQPVLTQMCDLVSQLDHSYLFIQGPPGTGKSYTGSKLIIHLLQQGHRVGVMANSHHAIHNLLDAVCERATEQSYTLHGCKKMTQGNAESEYQHPSFVNITSNTDVTQRTDNLLAGTVYFFADPLFANEEYALDYLVIDEAGQVSLADVIAAAQYCDNIILLGDQMQLSQPIQGCHPAESGLSVLDYLLQGKATIPPEHGIFLDQTYRVHSAISQVLSTHIYDGRLQSAAVANRRHLICTTDAKHQFLSAGLQSWPIEHQGYSQRCEPEANAVAVLLQRLLEQSVQNEQGQVRRLGLADVVILSPYNMQVNCLIERLPEGARVGTVDKFQGQEAAVVIVSMTTSHPDLLPRDISFAYSLNRLNVAVSRAQCLAVIVHTEAMRLALASHLDDIGRISFFADLTANQQAVMS